MSDIKTDTKITMLLLELKKRRAALIENDLLTINNQRTLSFALETLERCLVMWIPKKCIKCKNQIDCEFVPITDNYLCSNCVRLKN